MLIKDLRVGQLLWKYGYDKARIEAVGFDWLVVRELAGDVVLVDTSDLYAWAWELQEDELQEDE